LNAVMRRPSGNVVAVAIIGVILLAGIASLML
jgi:hypothetical protein